MGLTGGPESRTRITTAAFLLLGLAGMTGGSTPARGQDLARLTQTCGGGSASLLDWCTQGSLAVQAAQSALGLAAAGAADRPGTSSTLGWRLPRSPRFALSLRGSALRAPAPELSTQGGLASTGRTLLYWGGQVSLAAGAWDGFSLAPTVGGVLSLDVSVSAHWIRAPREYGLDGSGGGLGVGARVGLVRESFTLPGISLVGYHRRLGRFRLNDLDSGAPFEAAFTASVSSVRALVGKDLLGVGWTVGGGWDEYRGDFELQLADPALQGSGSSPVLTLDGNLRFRRGTVFAAGTLTFVILQVAAEAGWAEGPEPVLPQGFQGGFDPTRASFYASLAARLTL